MKTNNSLLGKEMFKEVDGITYKLCTKCLQYKPMSSEYFYKRGNVKCGFESHCKCCSKEKETKRVRVKPYDESGNLYCQCCKTYKPVSEFYPNSSSTKNRNYYSNNCKACESNKHKTRRARTTQDDPNIFFRDLATGCRGRSYRSGGKFKCTITKEDLVNLYESQKHKCALSGLTMTTIHGAGKYPYNASVDRINPGEDYSLNNIRLVCNHVNMMRSNLSDEQLIEFCKAIVENNG